MPRRFFQRFAIKRERLHTEWYLSPFRRLLHDPNLWAIRRRSVVPAFSLGVFVAFLPFPGHMLIGALSALALRVNIAVAALATLITNPLTMGPLYYFTYEVGNYILGRPPQPFEFEPTLDWLIDGFARVWQPLLLGSILAGAIAALVGYILLDALWRYSISDYLRKRRERRAAREALEP